MVSSTTRVHVANLLGVDQGVLLQAYEQRNVYERVFISKHKGGGKRVLHVPPEPLKSVQKNVHRFLLLFPWPEIMHGFVPERSYLTAAREHRRNQTLFTVDFKNAFDNVTADAVQEALAFHCEIPEDAAEFLADLCTNRNRLPQGAPSSPLLFNLVALRLAWQLEVFASSRRRVITLYADEVAVSSPSSLSAEERNTIIELCRAHGFRVPYEKTCYQEARYGALRFNSVLLFGTRLGLSDRKMVDYVRASVRRAAYDHTVPLDRIEGLLNWVKRVDPQKLNTRLRGPLRELRSGRGIRISNFHSNARGISLRPSRTTR